MSSELEKISQILEFMEKGGNDALFEVVEEIKALKDRISSLEGQDEVTPIIYEINALRAKIDAINIPEIDTPLAELKKEIIALIPQIPEQKDFTQDIEVLKSQIQQVSEKKDIVEIKETVIEREVIPESKIEEIKKGFEVKQITGEEIVDRLSELEDDERLSYKNLKDTPDIQEIKNAIERIHKFSGGGMLSVYDSTGKKIGSGSGIQFTGATVTHDGHRAFVSISSGGSSISVNTVEVTDPDFTDSTDISFDATGSTVTASFSDRTGHSVMGVAGGSSAPPAPIAMGSHSALIRNGGNVEATDAGLNTVLLRKTGDTLGFDKVTESELSASVNASLDLADSASQPGDNISDFTNDAGYVVGPASATDNAIARFNLTTGKLIQNSSATVDDSGNVEGNEIIANAPVKTQGGSASAPAITRETDTNTGRFYPANDTIAEATGGQERLRINSLGLVVGATTPNARTTSVATFIGEPSFGMSLSGTQGSADTFFLPHSQTYSSNVAGEGSWLYQPPTSSSILIQVYAICKRSSNLSNQYITTASFECDSKGAVTKNGVSQADYINEALNPAGSFDIIVSAKGSAIALQLQNPLLATLQWTFSIKLLVNKA